jgi:hypothetical protein
MAPDSGMALAIAVVIIGAVALPGLVLMFIAWRRWRAGRWAWWTIPLALPVGIALGVFLAFFVIFDDLGESYLAQRAAPTIEVRVPPDVRGSVYVFLDDAVAPLAPIGAKRYRVEVPVSGSVIAGTVPQRERVSSYIRYELASGDGKPPEPPAIDVSSGSFRGVSYKRFFVGTHAEYDADHKAREAQDKLFDDPDVYARLKAGKQ